MMIMAITLLKDFLHLAIELTVLFIGISIIISVLQGFIPYDKVNYYLSGKNTFLGIIAALLFAFVTPFCSCSTIPVVVNLLNRKVRFGIVMVFLFSSPVLDPTILTIMAATLGIKVSVVFVILTSVFSVIIGLTLEKLGFESSVKQVIMTGYEEHQGKFNLKTAVKETLVLMKTVYPYLLVGAAIGTVIGGLVPTEWISSTFGGNQWWLVPVAAIIGIPLYIRLSTMIPISQIFILKGMALGPVMALLISSAGASLPEITLLNSIFQRKLVITFIMSVIAMATLSGLIFYLV
jgi:uncharacterized membrane protein YraQ (UPF0718 family)